MTPASGGDCAKRQCWTKTEWPAPARAAVWLRETPAPDNADAGADAIKPRPVTALQAIGPIGGW